MFEFFSIYYEIFYETFYKFKVIYWKYVLVVCESQGQKAQVNFGLWCSIKLTKMSSDSSYRVYFETSAMDDHEIAIIFT